MSDAIKIKLRTKKVNIKTTDEIPSITFDYEDDVNKKNPEELFLEQQLAKKYQEGFEDGYNKAKAELEESFNQDLQTTIDEFNNILQEIQNQLSVYDKIFEPLVIETALFIAKKIIKRELDENSIIEENLRAALKKVFGANSILIKLNSEDYELIINRTNLKNEIENFNKIKFEIDDNLLRGDCVIETDIGNVDAKITTQMEELVTNLRLKIYNILIDEQYLE
ncbi:MAG TPA: FliH/SctL family protein [Ignavibacteriales bacterium]|nr:FliH/SctL family protein [Ignavibacteriales bacterium]HOL80702.1 FliH/SctL family protein [Ignavibacteriales bacterium]HOM64389.1 FliH/SctL family protein [Ignavibacteriales bacterium]HPD67177.1 FliH/SctL family protein [Ignavibacteriales bacterium]HPP32965.1 FliH/SctL family protein [Ignavibacteriales bacterium]